MVAPTTSPAPQPLDQPKPRPLTPLAAPDGTAAEAPHPTSDIAHPTSRAPLSQTDASLLSHIFRYRLDLDAAAASLGLDLATLLDFTDRPDIKPRIESYQRLRLASVNDKVLDLTASTRIDAIQQLSQLIKDTDNPIEKRRAIDLILRYTGPIAAAAQRTSTSRTSPRATSPSHPLTPSPTHSPSPSPSHPPTPTPTPTHSPSSSPSHPPTPSPTPFPPPPLSPDPIPLSTHIELLLTQEHKPAETFLPALHACFAPRAHLNKLPVPTDPAAFAKSIHPDVTRLLTTPCTFIDRTSKSTSPDTHTESLWFVAHRGPQYIVALTFKRETTDSPWQLHTLDTT